MKEESKSDRFIEDGRDEMEFELMHPASQICRIMERVYDMDMTSLTGGNISVMDDEGVMWVTPTSIDKKSLKPEDIVKVLPDGKIVGKHKPTSEYYIHRSILTRRPDIKAVIHAHAPATVTLSVLNRVPKTRAYQGAYEMIGEPKLTPYALPGSMELVKRVMEAFEAGHDSAILEKHSAFVGSKRGLLDAFKRFEALDFAARIEINSHILGKIRVLDKCILKEKQLPAVTGMRTFIVKRHTGKELEIRENLHSAIKRGYSKKLFTSGGGVMSARVDEKSFLIPESGTDNGTITLSELTEVKNGCREEKKFPHKTAILHQKIYEKHPDIQAVIIAAPVYTMGFAVTDMAYDTILYPESYGVLCDANRYGFEEFFNDIETVVQNLDLKHPMAIVENYGVILVGPTPILTFDKLEVCESSARSIHESHRLGLKPILMTQEQINEMNS